MAMYQAKDTFSATLRDGSSKLVTRGEAFHESHELVKLDEGRGVLFAPMESVPEPEPAPRKPAARASARAKES